MANWNTEEYDAPLSSSKGWNSERYDPISQGEAIRRGLLNGVTLGAAPYLGALGHMTQGGTFNQGLAQEQARDAAAEDQHPSLSFVSNAVGSIPPFGLGARSLKYAGLGNFASQVALNSGAGSIMGAFQPTQNGTFGEHFQNAAQAASLGTLTGLGIHAAGVPGPVTQEQYQKFDNWKNGNTLWEDTGNRAWNIHDASQEKVINGFRTDSAELEHKTNPTPAELVRKQQLDNIINSYDNDMLSTNQVGKPGTVIKPSLLTPSGTPISTKPPINLYPTSSGAASPDYYRSKLMAELGFGDWAYDELPASIKKTVDQGVSQVSDETAISQVPDASPKETNGLTPAEAYLYQSQLKKIVEQNGGGTTSHNYITPSDIHRNLLNEEVESPTLGGYAKQDAIQAKSDKGSLPGGTLGAIGGLLADHALGMPPGVSEGLGFILGSDTAPIVVRAKNMLGLSDAEVANRAATLADANGKLLDIGSYPENISRAIVQRQIPNTTAADTGIRKQYLMPNNQNLPTDRPIFPAQAGNIGPQTYGLDKDGNPTILLGQGFKNSNAGTPDTMGLMGKLEIPGNKDNLGTATSGKYSGFGSLGASALGNAGVNQVDQNYQVGDRLRALINDYMQ